MEKPYAESSEQNRHPILAVLRDLFADAHAVLEIGSGTGQHAVYFAEQLAHLTWHTSDRAEHHPGIKLWLDEAGLINTRHPVTLDVVQSDWPRLEVDAVFSANTAHIMHWHEVQAMFAGVGKLLSGGGRFALYGPFNKDHQYSSDSNARFDVWLKQRDPNSAIRDVGDLCELAQSAGMELSQNCEMPSNNRTLCWCKQL